MKAKRNPHKYTPGQLGFIEVMCRHLTDKELAIQINRVFGIDLTVDQIKGTRQRHGWLTGRDGRFEPGHARPMPPGRVYKANRGSFKKGNRSHTEQPVGTEVYRPKDGLIYVKVAEPKTWQSKQSLVWERHHGRKVPKGHVIAFADGDRLNFDIDNLRLLSRAELALFNKRRYGAAPAEVRPTLMLVAQLDRAAIDAQERE